MADEGIADLLEASPIDLRARGFRRVTRSRRAWDKRISDDIVWRISIDDDRLSSIYAADDGRFWDRMARRRTAVLRRQRHVRRGRGSGRPCRVGAHRHRRCRGRRRVACRPHTVVDRRSGRGPHGVVPSPGHRFAEDLTVAAIQWHIRGRRSIYASAMPYVPLNVRNQPILAAAASMTAGRGTQRVGISCRDDAKETCGHHDSASAAAWAGGEP